MYVYIKLKALVSHADELVERFIFLGYCWQRIVNSSLPTTLLKLNLANDQRNTLPFLHLGAQVPQRMMNRPRARPWAAFQSPHRPPGENIRASTEALRGGGTYFHYINKKEELRLDFLAYKPAKYNTNPPRKRRELISTTRSLY